MKGLFKTLAYHFVALAALYLTFKHPMNTLAMTTILFIGVSPILCALLAGMMTVNRFTPAEIQEKLTASYSISFIFDLFYLPFLLHKILALPWETAFTQGAVGVAFIWLAAALVGELNLSKLAHKLAEMKQADRLRYEADLEK